MPLAAGTRLGSYEVLSPLGAGGMGEVYRAHDSRLSRDVAIKILPEALASSPERLARFEREAKTVASLNHPNIVTLFSIEEISGVRFLTMELVEGRDLSTLIAPGGLPLARVLEVAIPLADAMVAAHDRRIVHRDLKPANVMMTRDGRIKVLDFGLAKLVEIGSDLELTRARSMAISDAGQVVGTLSYMAPEQIRAEDVDARADVFSFGIVLYELASGSRPFEGRSAGEVSSSILRDRARPLSSVRADLPADLGRIVARCLEKDPSQRFQTALEIANELRGLKQQMERGAPGWTRPGEDKAVSIAVLPFVNRSASADDEYFSDGLADELLTVLSKIRGLRVAARTSAFHFKGKDTTIPEIAAALHVDTVLEGTVRKAGQRVRIAVQLVKASDGYQLWSESYDRTLDDIFALQDDIAQSVVKELRRTLLGEEADSKASGEVRAEISQAAKGRATDPEAYRLCLLSRHLLDRRTEAYVEKAIGYLKSALGLDPDFALGWAELSQAYATLATSGLDSTKHAFALAREAAERALALEPDLAEAHAALAWIEATYDWDWKAAELSYRRAMELAPGHALVFRRAGVLAMTLGHLEEGVRLTRRAIEIDPLSGSAYHNLGLVLTDSGRLTEGEQALWKALEVHPERSVTHADLSVNLMLQGRHREAADEANREPAGPFRLWAQAVVQGARGNHSEESRALGELIEKYGDGGAFQVAEIHAAAGRVDEAFAWLERAYESRDSGLGSLKRSTLLRPLRGDPRWPALVQKMGLGD